MRSLVCSLITALMALLFSCGNDRPPLPTSLGFSPPPMPTNFTVTGGEERSILSWSYSAPRGSVEKFKIYRYFETYDTVEPLGTTTDTVFVDSLLIGNLYYCYKISAVDSAGFEGWRTAQECAFVRTSH